jgi:hypothetical protein
MPNHLTGFARTWCDNLTTYPYTWEWKKNVVDKNFSRSCCRWYLETITGSVKTILRDHDSTTLEKLNLPQVCNIDDKEANSCLVDELVDHTLKINGAKAELLSVESALQCMEPSIVYRQVRRFCCCWAGAENEFELKQILLSWFF